MTALWAIERPKAPDGRPCWEANPLVVVPRWDLEPTPAGRVVLRMMVPSSEHSMAFHQIEAEIDPAWLPQVARDWWEGPEGALEKWWSHTARLDWGSATPRAAAPLIVATQNPEDLGL